MSEPTSGGQLPSDLGTNDVAAGTSGRGTQRRQQRGTINANHLLNFQSGAREARNDPTALPRRRPSAARSSRSSRPAAYDRAKFLQANFRFIISDASDIQKYEADPDLMLNWDDIAAVDVITSTPIQCPITLGPPLCPCITPCGHIFSEEAIMAHMLAQAGPELRTSSACPVCTTQVSSRELRPVAIRHVTVLSMGDRTTLKLLKRGKDSIIPHPVGAEDTQQADSNTGNRGSLSGESVNSTSAAAAVAAAAWRRREGKPAHLATSTLDKDTSNGINDKEVLSCNLYAKFTPIANPMPLWSYRIKFLSKQIVQLLKEGGTDATYEVPPLRAAIDAMLNRARAWIERRQRLLIEQLDDDEMAAALAGGALAAAELAGKEAMAMLKQVAEVTSVEEEKVYKKSAAVQALEEAFPALYVQDHQKGRTTMAGATAMPTTTKQKSGQLERQNLEEASQIHAVKDSQLNSTTTTTVNLSTSPSPAASSAAEFYFYQSIDGQLIFLCPLNMKMLADWTGSYTSLPYEITATVLELEEIEQTEATRRRLKSCCGHVPLGGTFKLCEVALSEILPSEALTSFEAELTQREKKRVQIAKLEARKSHREAAKAKSMAAAAAAAALGPSAAELASMPLPGASSFSSSEPVPVPRHSSSEILYREGDELAAGASPSSSSSFPGSSSAGGGGGSQPSGLSFARIAKMGFAATGPALGEGLGSPPTPPWGGNSASPGTSVGVWPGNQSHSGVGGGAWGSNSNTNSALPQTDLSSLASSSTPRGGGKKKGKKMVLLSTSHRY